MWQINTGYYCFGHQWLLYLITVTRNHLKVEKELVLFKNYCFSLKTVLITVMTAPMTSPKNFFHDDFVPTIQSHKFSPDEFSNPDQASVCKNLWRLRRSNHRLSQWSTELFHFRIPKKSGSNKDRRSLKITISKRNLVFITMGYCVKSYVLNVSRESKSKGTNKTNSFCIT